MRVPSRPSRPFRPSCALRITAIALALAGAARLTAEERSARSPPGEEATAGERGQRVRRGLRALYTFENHATLEKHATLQNHDGETILDRSAVGTPLDLHIQPGSSTRRSDGSLRVSDPSTIRSLDGAGKIFESSTRSGALTLEVWLRTDRLQQKGPARILTLSGNTSERNFTLGQDESRFDVRLRTTETDANGNPSLATPSDTVRNVVTHVVYTFDPSGRARLWVDGELVAQKRVKGSLSAWSSNFQLGLANEISGDRPWLGELFLVAIYNRSLDPDEIAQNFAAGHKINASPGDLTREIASRRVEDPLDTPLARSISPEAHFATRIAPILRQHCLECHSARTEVKGRLDLSTRAQALRGGKTGPLLVAARPEESLLWTLVSDDEMPRKRPPLSAEEKDLLRAWIEDGAVWSVDLVRADAIVDAPIRRHHELDCDEIDRDPGPSLPRRLTVDEYIETVRAAVGVDIEKEAREILPRDLRADGFSNTAYNLGVDLEHIEAYTRLAEQIVSRMDLPAFVRARGACFDLTEPCLLELIPRLGAWILRAPLPEEEIRAYLGIVVAVVDEGGDFDEALGFLLEALLQSPRFIYRVEDRRGDGAPRRVNAWELASRLGYAIWGGPPDEPLLAAARNGRLETLEDIDRETLRMLEDPRAIEHSKRFATEWLHLDRLTHLRPGRELYPDWDPALAEDMRRETLAFFEDVVWRQERPLGDLFNAQITYVTARLARHYGLTPLADGVNENELIAFDLNETPGRGGLLTQGSVLTLGGDEASMVARGLFVLRDVLSSGVGDPPPGTDTTPVPARAGLSKRKIAEHRVANGACGGCHARFEPLAYALEKFDGVGAYHETDEHGNNLEEDGEILWPGEDTSARYDSIPELMDLLASSDRVSQTITMKVVQWVLGRPLVASDSCHLRKIHAFSMARGGTYASLLLGIARSDLLLLTRTETDR